MAELLTGHVKDNEAGKFFGDAFNKATVRIGDAWTINSAFALMSNYLSLDGFRYYTQREDSEFVYLEYFNADDDYIGGIKISKTEKKAELFYPNLLVQDFDRLLLENNEGVLI